MNNNYVQFVGCAPLRSVTTNRNFPEKCETTKVDCDQSGIGFLSYYGAKISGTKPEYIDSSEENIMKAIYFGGPIAVNMKVFQSMIEHRNGNIIYSPKPEECSGKDTSGTTHAVSLSGWGVEEGKKYWMVEDSYGPFFSPFPEHHNQGFFKVIRGEPCLEIDDKSSLLAVQDPTMKRLEEDGSYTVHEIKVLNECCDLRIFKIGCL
jgi:hypothetical protein